MFFSGHHHGFARLPTALFRPTVRKGEPTVVFGQKDGYNGRVPVHHGFLARTVLHPEHTHAIILRLDGVVIRIDLNGICKDWLGSGSRRHIRLLEFLNEWPEGFPGEGGSIRLGPRPRNPRKQSPPEPGPQTPLATPPAQPFKQETSRIASYLEQLKLNAKFPEDQNG